MSATGAIERAITFACSGDQLVGVAHSPSQPRDVGVVIVVGGPQYRIGSHRQFLLLARELAADGFPVFRFDYRGMGDSDGQLRGFEHVSEDIRAAIDEFLRQSPTVKRIVLWGLCDGATAAATYAPRDRRVCGLVLLNPWVRSDQTLARSLLFHYYARRIVNPAAWRKMIGDPAAWRRAVASFVATLGTVIGARRPRETAGIDSIAQADAQANGSQAEAQVNSQSNKVTTTPLVARIALALNEFDGPILTILSGADITANEFVEAVKGNRKLRRRLKRSSVTQHRLAAADHTFSTARWRDQVALWTRDWLRAQ